MAEALLEVDDLGIVYKGREEHVFAVNGLTFQLPEGATLGIVGETGAGKTTTALGILGLLHRTAVITKGSIRYKGRELLILNNREMKKIRGGEIAMIFQDPMTSLNPVLTVGDQIKEALENHNTENLSSAEIEKKVISLLKTVQIEKSRKGEYPHQFSGGMKQRIVIAIALACNPKLIIADEPTTALDVTIQSQILRLMERLKMLYGTSMIMISHDLGVIAKSCDHVAVMYAGKIVEYGSLAQIFDREAGHHPYTGGLFRAIPDLHSKNKRLVPIGGKISDPSDLPEGCTFHPRCEKCMDICRVKEPGVYEKDGHSIACHLFGEDAQ